MVNAVALLQRAAAEAAAAAVAFILLDRGEWRPLRSQFSVDWAVLQGFVGPNSMYRQNREFTRRVVRFIRILYAHDDAMKTPLAKSQAILLFPAQIFLATTDGNDS